MGEKDWELNGSGYDNRVARIGPTPPKRTTAEWAHAIESPDPIDVLEALTHVLGQEWNRRRMYPGVPTEFWAGEAGLVHAAVTRRLTDPEPWIREAAQAASSVLGE